MYQTFTPIQNELQDYLVGYVDSTQRDNLIYADLIVRATFKFLHNLSRVEVLAPTMIHA